jgi:hypothetical protein
VAKWKGAHGAVVLARRPPGTPPAPVQISKRSYPNGAAARPFAARNAFDETAHGWPRGLYANRERDAGAEVNPRRPCRASECFGFSRGADESESVLASSGGTSRGRDAHASLNGPLLGSSCLVLSPARGGAVLTRCAELFDRVVGPYQSHAVTRLRATLRVTHCKLLDVFFTCENSHGIILWNPRVISLLLYSISDADESEYSKVKRPAVCMLQKRARYRGGDQFPA